MSSIEVENLSDVEMEGDPSPPPVPAPEPSPQSASKKQRQSGQKCGSCITVWGWIFDLMTVGISISDVVSDILVAIQFYQDDHKTWFWLVVISLILSNILYTVFFVEVKLRHDIQCTRDMDILRVFWYILIFPIAQLTPVINWIIETVSPSSQYDTQSTLWRSESYTFETVREEVDAIAGSTTIMERLDKALVEHFRSHMLFYIECAVESIPQSVVQLLAITFLGQATPLQVVSMSLSLTSIVSKAYTISHSFTVAMFAFKFLVASHDVFSLFYVFSTLLAAESSRDVQIFDTGLYVNYLSAVWLVKELVIAAAAVVALLIFAGVGIWEEFIKKQRAPSLKDVGVMILLVLLGALLAVPGLIAIEGLKLLWLVLFIAGNEPSYANFPALSTLFYFCHRGSYKDRLRYALVHEAMPTYKTIFTSDSDGPGIPRNARGQVLVRYHDEQTEAKILRICAVKPFRPHYLLNYTDVRRPLLNADGKPVAGSSSHQSFSSGLRSMHRIEVVMFVLIGIGLVIYTLSQLFSFVFPFISCGMANWTGLNLLQKFCFCMLSGSLLVVICLAPHAYKYSMFLAHTQYIVGRRRMSRGRRFRSSNCFLTAVHNIIQEYHMPPYVAVVQASIPNEVIPTDVTGVVAEFMTEDQVNLRQLTVADSAKLKAECEELVGEYEVELDFPPPPLPKSEEHQEEEGGENAKKEEEEKERRIEESREEVGTEILVMERSDSML